MKKIILLAILNSTILPVTNLFGAIDQPNAAIDLKATAQMALINTLGTQAIYYAKNKALSQKAFLISCLIEIVDLYKDNPRAANYVDLNELDFLIETKRLDSIKTADQFIRVVKLDNILCDLFKCEQGNLHNYVNTRGLAGICVKILQDDKTVYAEDIVAVFNIENISDITGIEKLLIMHTISSNFPARPVSWLRRKLSYIKDPLSKLKPEQLNQLYGLCVSAAAGSGCAFIINGCFSDSSALATYGTGIAVSGASFWLMRNPTWSKIVYANIANNYLSFSHLRNLLFKRDRFSYDKFIASLSDNQKNMLDAKTLADAEIKPTLLVNNQLFINSLSNSQFLLFFELLKMRSITIDGNLKQIFVSLTDEQSNKNSDNAESVEKFINMIFISDLQGKAGAIVALNSGFATFLDNNQIIIFRNYLESKNVNIDSLENLNESLVSITSHHKLITQKYNDKSQMIAEFTDAIETSPEYRAFSETLSQEQKLILRAEMFVRERWNIHGILKYNKFMEMLSPNQVVLLDKLFEALVDDNHTINQVWLRFINSLTREQQASIFNNKFAYKCFLGVYDTSLVGELVTTMEFLQILTPEQIQNLLTPEIFEFLTDEQKLFLRSRI